MPVFLIEFWGSLTGKPNSFSYLGSVPEATSADGSPAGTPVSTSQSLLKPGYRGFYTARRVMFSDEDPTAPVYSEFSGVKEAAVPNPAVTKGISMDAIHGSETVLGFGLQPKTDPQDKPYKAKTIFENTGGRIRPALGTFGSRALRNDTVRRGKTGAGRATFPFSIPIEATPNLLPYVFCAMYGAPVQTVKVGGIPVTLTANAAQGATSLTVAALTADILQGSVLNFSVDRTVNLTADAAKGATALTVAALPSGIPANTAVNINGLYFRVTVSAAQGATSLTTSPLPAAFTTGATLNYTDNRYVTVSANVPTGATVVPVVATGFALATGDSASFGAKYKHYFINGKSYNVGTFSQLVGDAVECSPGALINTMEFTVDYDMETFVTPTIAGNALNQTQKYTLAQTGLDIGIVDAVNAFSMIDARLVIGGVISDDAKSVAVSMNRNARAKGVLRRKRGPASQRPSTTDITMTLTLYHTSDAFTQKYFGQTTEQTGPYGITCRVPTMPVSLEFATCPLTGDPLPYEWGFEFPKASIDTDEAPIDGPDEIMETVTLIGNRDSTINSDVRMYVVCDLSLADLLTPSSAVAVVPANHVSTYVAP